MLAELRKVIPAFLRRVDDPDRGGAWSAYLAAHASARRGVARPPRLARSPGAGVRR